MNQWLMRVIVMLTTLIGIWGLASPAASANPDPEALGQAVAAIETLDTMRSSLAATLDGRTTPPDLETFKQVCQPVGMQVKRLSQDQGWQVKQISEKYRNPAHKPDNAQAVQALARFEANPDLIGFWDRETSDDQSGRRYYRRINVEASCLGCHGGLESRPEFVKQNYPEDRAYDFQVGDLRGMYAVFIPDDLQQTIQTSLQRSAP